MVQPDEIVIDPWGDREIVLTTDEPVVRLSVFSVASPKHIRSITTIQVRNSVLIAAPNASGLPTSNYFQRLLHGGFKETDQNSISLEEDDEKAMAVFLRVLHHLGINLTFTYLIRYCGPSRGRLRTMLHRELFKDAFICTYKVKKDKCKIVAEYNFHRALYETTSGL
ncbi:hypothetical protein EJ08DRAFT_738648 [Tothia fuscella]|uniref:Uncharacterized protein n=1 Tax=Tothia fuscella TaxID=1048955 RepID=A0A9P4NGI9_9PEZI|nr:hypothetical protein EJ08DRAFT_738648 [Tothia fuscella]